MQRFIMAGHQVENKVNERTVFRAGVNYGRLGGSVEYKVEDKHHAINSEKCEKQFIRSQKSGDKRKRVAQGATAGFFAGGLLGGGAGAGIGAVIGSIVPGVGTLIGAAVGATIGGITGAGTVGGAGVAVGAGVAAVLPDDKD